MPLQLAACFPLGSRNLSSRFQMAKHCRFCRRIQLDKLYILQTSSDWFARCKFHGDKENRTGLLFHWGNSDHEHRVAAFSPSNLFHARTLLPPGKFDIPVYALDYLALKTFQEGTHTDLGMMYQEGSSDLGNSLRLVELLLYWDMLIQRDKEGTE
eukprot:gb/GECG01006650.1/.p1 GENE.gb/GECG01006650.1/~~gb/GECG01006650.1/.p1  ORF type:complete len:155 (+),score=7.40 gb/GECG01006650.1/:1-465(+)